MSKKMSTGKREKKIKDSFDQYRDRTYQNSTN